MTRAKRLFAVVTVAVVALFAPIVFVAVRSSIREKRLAPFNARIADFTTALKIPNAAEPVGGAVKGKVIVIDTRERKCDAVFFSLADDLRPETPDEVQTVVWIDWNQEDYGKYSNGATALVWGAEVTVIDKSGPRVVARRNFHGTPPPDKIRAPQGSSIAMVYGDRPEREIADFIRSLR